MARDYEAGLVGPSRLSGVSSVVFLAVQDEESSEGSRDRTPSMAVDGVFPGAISDLSRVKCSSAGTRA